MWYARQLSVALRKDHRINSMTRTVTRKQVKCAFQGNRYRFRLLSLLLLLCIISLGKRFVFSPPPSRAKGVLVIRATVSTVIYGQSAARISSHGFGLAAAWGYSLLLVIGFRFSSSQIPWQLGTAHALVPGVSLFNYLFLLHSVFTILRSLIASLRSIVSTLFAFCCSYWLPYL